MGQGMPTTTKKGPNSIGGHSSGIIGGGSSGSGSISAMAV